MKLLQVSTFNKGTGEIPSLLPMNNPDSYDNILKRKVTTDELRKIQEKYNAEVANPVHYNKGIETTDYIISNNMNFAEGNVIKYVTRYKEKDGLKDLLKAKWYLEKLIETSQRGSAKQNKQDILGI